MAFDAARRSLGGKEPKPLGEGKCRQSDLGKGRDVGCHRQGLIACNRVAFYAPGPHQREGGRSAEEQVDVAGHQVLHYGGSAAIGHESKLRPGFFLEEQG
jgi:hypothetical protein